MTFCRHTLGPGQPARSAWAPGALGRGPATELRLPVCAGEASDIGGRKSQTGRVLRAEPMIRSRIWPGPLCVFSVTLLMCWLSMPGTLTADSQPLALPEPARKTLRLLAIQHNGRHKPFDSFARETLQLITGSSRVDPQDPVETVFDMMANPEHWQQRPLVSVPFIPLREALGIPPKSTHISYNDLVASRTLMRMLPPIVQKQQRDEKLTIQEEETMDVFQRFVGLSNLLEQKLELIPPQGSTERVWLSLEEPTGYSPQQQQAIRAMWTDLLSAVRTGEAGAMTTTAQQTAAFFQQLKPSAYPARWRLQLEVFYNRAAPFHLARIVYLLAVIGLLLGMNRRGTLIGQWSLGLVWLAFALHGAGIAMRVIIGGRPPVSNFFETTLWLPFVGVLLALIFERVYRAQYFALAASILAALMLMLADYLPLDSSISPVVAVLHSNLWLSIHVLTIVASYGALALATVLAHVYGWLYLRRSPKRTLEALNLFLYRTIQVGVVLLAGGVMLGAVWANASWGRYWGWDPKETWALITLLWFVAILHGRFAGWIHGVGIAFSTIGGFFLLLMTYYGVSFYLVGLHSYAGGHATPLPPLLIGYLIAEVIFMALIGFSALKRE